MGKGYSQPANIFYAPAAFATDTAHCPTLIAADSATIGLQLLRCVAAWRDKGYLEASIDSLVFTTPTRILARAHLGPRYRVMAFSNDSISPRHATIAVDAATALSKRIAGSLSPNDRIAVSLSIHDSTVVAAVTRDSIARSLLIEIRQDGPLKLHDRALRALLQYRLGVSTIAPSDLGRLETILASLPYARTTHAPVLEFIPGGAILHLFLAARKANTLQAGVGFQPRPSGKGVDFYGSADIDLRSLFKQGERLRASWRSARRNEHDISVRAAWNRVYGSAWGVALETTFTRQDSTASRFAWGSSVRFAPTPFQRVEAAYQHEQLTELRRIAGSQSMVAQRAQSYKYSLGFEFEQMNYSLDWPQGCEAHVKATIADRRSSDGGRRVLLSVSAEGELVAAIGGFGLQFQGNARYENRNINHAHDMQLGTLEIARIGGAKSIRGYLESAIATSHYAMSTLGLNWAINAWAMPRLFTDVGLFFDSPRLRGALSVGAGIVAQASAGTLTLDIARGFALTDASPRGDWILHMTASVRF